jgi:hypothetical protein
MQVALERGADLEALASPSSFWCCLERCRYSEQIGGCCDGCTPLMLAAHTAGAKNDIKSSSEVQLQILRTLLQLGANMDGRNPHGETALMMAGSEAAVEILLKYGADASDMDEKWRMRWRRISEGLTQ